MEGRRNWNYVSEMFFSQEDYTVEAAGASKASVIKAGSLRIINWAEASRIWMQGKANNGDDFPDALVLLVIPTSYPFGMHAHRDREKNTV